MRKPRSSARERILEAAEKVVSEEGAAHLTLDAVAAEAKVSKGGLLYHFGTKDKLLRAMVGRHLERFDQDREHAAEGLDPQDPGAALKAFVMAAFRDDPRRKRVSAALLAAGATNPRLLTPVRRWREELRTTLAEGVRSPLRAMAVILALDGFWMGELLQTTTFGPQERRELMAALLQLADEAV